MTINPSENLIELSKLLPGLHLTGGCVRNMLLGVPASDIDVCAPLPVDEVISRLEGSAFSCGKVYRRTGTLAISRAESGESYEYAVFRTEKYAAGHTPESVSFCARPEEDALRRDFTINSIYYDISNGKIIDPLGGIPDLENKLIRAHDPERIFADDGLRLLRMVRFAAQLGFRAEPKTLETAARMGFKLSEITRERIAEEFLKILYADTAYPVLTQGTYPHYLGLKMLERLGYLAFALPELLKGKGMKQRADFHRHDVLEHTLQTVKFSPPRVRVAALLHDIAKPERFLKTGRFAGHDEAGEALSAKICRENLCLNSAQTARVSKLVALHMVDLDGKTREGKLRRFIATNIDYFDDLLLLIQSDYLGSGLHTDTAPGVLRLSSLKDKMAAEGAPFKPSQLKIGGNDVLAALPDIEKPLIGKLLETLHMRAVTDPLLNSRERLLTELRHAYAELKRTQNKA